MFILLAKKINIILLVILSSPFCIAGLSAKLPNNQTYENYVDGLRLNNGPRNSSVYSKQKKYKDFSLKELMEIPDFASLDLLDEVFFKYRDSRFIDFTDDQEQFGGPAIRRLSWLYPDDGCFARTEIFIHEMIKDAYPAPKRIFVFGELKVKTDNHPDKSVRWWYHTTPIVRVGESLYIFDPAMDAYAPMLLEDWLAKMGFMGEAQIKNASISICSPFSYDPEYSCLTKDSNYPIAINDIYRYLRLEVDRQIRLNRDPDIVLGEKPPWLNVIDKGPQIN
jgi:hypothetical protein